MTGLPFTVIALVADQLARFSARGTEKPMRYTTLSRRHFEQLQQRLAGRRLAARGFLVSSCGTGAPERRTCGLQLLLAQLRAVIRQAGLAALALDAAGRHLQLALALERLRAALQEAGRCPRGARACTLGPM